MDRREVLAALGAGGVLSAGVGGLYLSYRGDDPLDFLTPEESEDGFWGADGDGADDTEEDDPEVPTRDGDVLFGVSPTPEIETWNAFEEWLGEPHAVAGQFIDMGASDEEIDHLVHGSLETIWDRGHVPHVYWQPFLPSQEAVTPEINHEIRSGDHDERIEAWATTLADWALVEDGPDKRVYLNLAPEFNGDWSPWSPAVGNEIEDDFVGMWQRVHEIVADAGLEDDHVQWIWTLDNTTRGVDREACYPGDAYVDWAGVHGYNWVEWGWWQSPEEVYGPTVEFIQSITDAPIALTEFGSSSETENGGHNPERKEDWIREAFEYVGAENIQMTLWFNLIKETDWAVFDAEHGPETVSIDGVSYDVYPAYKEVVKGESVLGGHEAHPRRLTDEEFQGNF